MKKSTTTEKVLGVTALALTLVVAGPYVVGLMAMRSAIKAILNPSKLHQVTIEHDGWKETIYGTKKELIKELEIRLEKILKESTAK